MDLLTKKQFEYGHGVFRLGGFAGTGKSSALDSVLQTPIGPVLMQEIRVGDEVFGRNGWPTRVTGVFPQGMLQAYRVTFRDKSSTEVSADHLWSVWTQKLRAKKAGTVVKTTQEMLSKGVKFKSGLYRYYIPLCSPVQYSEKDLPIPPYTLGVALGDDGTRLGKCPALILSDSGIIARVAEELPEHTINEDTKPGCIRYRLTWPQDHTTNPLTRAFRELHLDVLAPKKFIPTVYLQGSEQQRWDILRGLMDTDGCSKKNRIRFSTSSRQLAEDVCTLVQSLGGTAVYAEQDRGDRKSVV